MPINKTSMTIEGIQLFTVVLLRPDYLCEEPYGQDIYVAIGIQAAESCEAVEYAQLEAFSADVEAGIAPRAPEDYALCVAFKGAHEPTLFGWQAH